MQTRDSLNMLRLNMSKLSERDQGFAESLILQAESRRGLSDKQYAWVQTLTERALNPQAKPEIALGESFKGVIDLLDTARSNLKFPKLRIDIGGQRLQLSIAGENSRAPGTVNVTNTERGYNNPDRIWYGRVTREGIFEPSMKSTAETNTAIAAALKAIAQDPANFASEYGRLTGCCTFCGLPLVDDRSTEVGYGPQCATKWGLPWGRKSHSSNTRSIKKYGSQKMDESFAN